MRFTPLLFLVFLAINNPKCTAQIASSNGGTSNKSGIITGADQIEEYLPFLKGKRIGLVANDRISGCTYCFLVLSSS